eukprot:11200616-Alexandrium_andersonii.AAC.1
MPSTKNPNRNSPPLVMLQATGRMQQAIPDKRLGHDQVLQAGVTETGRTVALVCPRLAQTRSVKRWFRALPKHPMT